MILFDRLVPRVAVVALVVLAACGGGGGDESSAGSGDVSTSTTAAAPGDETATGDDAGNATGDDAGGAPSTTAAAGESTATAAGGAPPVSATGGGGEGSGAGTEGTAAPAPLPAGTYRYRQEGSAKVGTDTYDSPPEGTSVVEAAGADGTQVVHRYVDPEAEPSDTTLRFGPDGIFIVETVLRMGKTAITCTFDPPLPAPSWPPAIGAKSGGTGECGAFTTDVSSEITEARTVTLDGKDYDAFVVKSTITTSGQVTSTTHQLDWFVPELRLSAHTETDSKGSFGAFTFESKGTSDLLSAVPA